MEKLFWCQNTLTFFRPLPPLVLKDNNTHSLSVFLYSQKGRTWLCRYGTQAASGQLRLENRPSPPSFFASQDCTLWHCPCAMLMSCFSVGISESPLLFVLRLTTRNLTFAKTTSRWKQTFYEYIFHLNYMHCLPMFIASQREFGGKTEPAKYGFDYRDLYQKWNSAFYWFPTPFLPHTLCPLL